MNINNRHGHWTLPLITPRKHLQYVGLHKIKTTIKSGMLFLSYIMCVLNLIQLEFPCKNITCALWSRDTNRSSSRACGDWRIFYLQDHSTEVLHYDQFMSQRVNW